MKRIGWAAGLACAGLLLVGTPAHADWSCRNEQAVDGSVVLTAHLQLNDRKQLNIDPSTVELMAPGTPKGSGLISIVHAFSDRFDWNREPASVFAIALPPRGSKVATVRLTADGATLYDGAADTVNVIVALVRLDKDKSDGVSKAKRVQNASRLTIESISADGQILSQSQIALAALAEREAMISDFLKASVAKAETGAGCIHVDMIVPAPFAADKDGLARLHGQEARVLQAPSSRSLALARRIVEAQPPELQPAALVGSASVRPTPPKSQMEALAQLIDRLTPAELKAAEQTALDSVQSDLKETTVRAVARTFTDEQLDGIARFYESEPGKAWAGRSPIMLQANMLEVMPLIEKVRRRTLTLYCAKQSCAKDQLDELRRLGGPDAAWWPGPAR